MTTLVGIGDFSKMTYLSIKALRHYHEEGVLEPAAIDPATGYRRYTTSQVPIAQAIRRFRDLEMPLDEIRLVLQTPDIATRNRVILGHLERMQQQLEQTQLTVASLQAVLSNELHSEGQVEVRRLPSMSVLTMVSSVSFDDCATWLEFAQATLHAKVETAGTTKVGADGALYSDQFFEAGAGEVTAFLPVTAGAKDIEQLPAITVALLVHDGPFSDLDRTYGALGTVVAERGIGGRGPIREHYIGATTTEVCWPVTAG